MASGNGTKQLLLDEDDELTFDRFKHKKMLNRKHGRSRNDIGARLILVHVVSEMGGGRALGLAAASKASVLAAALRPRCVCERSDGYMSVLSVRL
uniref:RF_PROK_I domain-containing protein n=1 Tax=Syphacia muris TaxID=451379 RepID=A0A0N5AB88_9BILA